MPRDPLKIQQSQKKGGVADAYRSANEKVKAEVEMVMNLAQSLDEKREALKPIKTKVDKLASLMTANKDDFLSAMTDHSSKQIQTAKSWLDKNLPSMSAAVTGAPGWFGRFDAYKAGVEDGTKA